MRKWLRVVLVLAVLVVLFSPAVAFAQSGGGGGGGWYTVPDPWWDIPAHDLLIMAGGIALEIAGFLVILLWLAL